MKWEEQRRSTNGGLAGVVEAEEEEFGVLVGQPELGQHIPDYASSVVLVTCESAVGGVHQSMIHMLAHWCCSRQ